MTSSGVDWSKIQGASKKPKRLHLVGDEEGIFQCPVPHCDYMGFSSQRGCRKHVKNKHGWFYYFDVKPDLKLSRTNVRPHGKGSILLEKSHRAQTSTIPSFTKDTPFGHEIVNWLQSMAGGGKSKCLANQVLSKSLKYIRFCSEDFLDEEVTESNIDYCLGSTTHIYRFFDYLEKDFDVSASGRIGYINALLDVMDFRKFKGLNFDTLQNFSIVEIYLKKIRKCMGKEMRIHWKNDLDVDTLESKGSWATLKELQLVLPYHVPRYKVIVENCKTCASLVSPSDLTFATRFIATFLFLKIKATRPMTYQYLTVEMFEHAKTTGGYIDQKLFKTTGTYGFDSIILDNISMKVIGNYIEFVRPLLQPACGFILVNRNGTQFGKLTDLLSKLVYDAIGKYIHPTRYRQIIETESSAILDLDEQQWVSEDQKHSSKVAKTHYQKKHSRDITVKGQFCLKKLRCAEGEHVEKSLQTILGENTNPSSHLTGATDEETSIHVDEIPRANCKADQKSCDSFKIRKPLVFTPEEDEYIKSCIEKYENLWTVMLKDPELRFSPGRTTDALIKRARSKAFREKFGHS